MTNSSSIADRLLTQPGAVIAATCKHPNFVTLNLFQGPSRRKLGAIK